MSLQFSLVRIQAFFAMKRQPPCRFVHPDGRQSGSHRAIRARPQPEYQSPHPIRRLQIPPFSAGSSAVTPW